MSLVKQQIRLNYLESHSSCGDAGAVSLSSGATGTNHAASLVFQAKVLREHRSDMSKYDGGVKG